MSKSKHTVEGHALTNFQFMFNGTPASEWTFKNVEYFTRALVGLGGHTYREIAEILNKLNLTTKRGREWSEGNVNTFAQKFSRFTQNPAALEKLSSGVDAILNAPHQLPLTPTATIPAPATVTGKTLFISAGKKLNAPEVKLPQNSTDAELADLLREISIVPMDETFRRAVMTQMIRGIRADKN